MRRPIAWFIIVFIAATGCAGRAARTEARRGREAHTISGHIAYEGHHRTRGDERMPPEVRLSTGHGSVPLLRVCVIQQHGANDLNRFDHLFDDEKLGCTVTGVDGTFSIPLSKADCRPGRDCTHKLYLATDLCAIHSGQAQACISANTQQGPRVHDVPWRDDLPSRKYMWSDTYRIDFNARTSNFISWNLSCPGDAGEGMQDLRCARPARGGFFDRAHSNVGHNDESVHAYVAAARAVELVGDMVPRARTALGNDGCSAKGASRQMRRECSDAIRVIVRKMRHLADEPRACARRTESVDYAPTRRNVCIGSPFNPWIVAHEIGHVVHVRWMSYDGPINDEHVNWTGGSAQKSQTGEGWADFFAAAALYTRDTQAPTFNGHTLEGSTSCRGRPQGEGHAARFFWDLYDPAHPAEPGENVSIDFARLLEVWSLFPGKDGIERRDRVKGECGPHGRNVWDFRHHMGRHPAKLPDPLPLMRTHCLDAMEPRMQCAGGR